MVAPRPLSIALPLACWMTGAAPPALAAPEGWTTRVSVGSAGAQGNDHSGDSRPVFAAGGRLVAFASRASNLVPGDTNGVEDVFVRDRFLGTTTRASVSSSGAEPNSAAQAPAISADGRYVAFASAATNLVVGDTNGTSDVFVHDRQTGLTTRVSLGPGGGQANEHSADPSISADGRYVAFSSRATNLVPGDTNANFDVFVRDTQTGTTECASLSTGGSPGNSASRSPSLSADGQEVAFESVASDLVLGDTNGKGDIFVRDRAAAVTVRASLSSLGAEGDGYCLTPSISADGRYVAFHTVATNLVPGHTDIVDLLVRDLSSAATERVGTSTYGTNPSGPHISLPSLSGDGRFVVFDSDIPLVAGDTNNQFDVFLRDRQTGAITRVSVGPGGAQANLSSSAPAISADSRYAAFSSHAFDLVAGDTNGDLDTFVHDRDATSFTSLCSPGAGSVIPCPCANPPSGPDRGCDNSSATGGAALSASGIAYLSADSLVFATSGERSTSLSILAQWLGGSPSGVVFGMGVRCTSGTFKRLFNRNAVGGSITVPDLGLGDPTVSARSAAKGDTILAGQSRWYVVYYRDPNVLGGCPPLSNFNATQTGQLTWGP